MKEVLSLAFKTTFKLGAAVTSVAKEVSRGFNDAINSEEGQHEIQAMKNDIKTIGAMITKKNKDTNDHNFSF